MDSGMIGKIQKSKYYAEEPERICFEQFRVALEGTNAQHTVSYDGGTWSCTCNFFATRGVCSHTMAMERLLGVMLPPEAVTPVEAAQQIA
ncbi:SWIM zinc finger family protein [Chloroflexota bacterium]